MEEFARTIIIFCLIGFVSLEPVPNLIKVRRREDGKGAEFVALDTVGLIEQFGYPAEQHNLTTEDGYMINIFRIPWSPKSPNNTSQKPVIFLMSGMAASSDAWLVLGANRSLALQLADEGYDVWLGNHRGNAYGRAHVTLSPNDAKFWAHSQDEVGFYDLPNSFDYVLNYTNQPTFTYIGHSLGATLILMTLSEHPEYNDKIEVMFFFGPPVFWVKDSLLMRFFIWIGYWFPYYFDPNASIEVFPQSSVLSSVFTRICMPNRMFDLCYTALGATLGDDFEQLDRAKTTDYFLYWPAGTSSRLLYQYSQAIKSGKFRHWDFYKPELNMQHYGQPEPPEYNLKNIKPPMIIFYGKNDPLGDIENIRVMMERVSSRAIAEPIKFKNFNHLDFVIAKDVKKLVNDRVVQRLAEFRKGKIPFLLS